MIEALSGAARPRCARRQLLAGKAASVRQFVPHFAPPGGRGAGARCAFVGLDITACGLLDEEVRAWHGVAVTRTYCVPP